MNNKKPTSHTLQSHNDHVYHINNIEAMSKSTSEEWMSVGKIKEASGLGGSFYVLLFVDSGDWVEKFQEIRLVHDERASVKGDGSQRNMSDDQKIILEVNQRRPHKKGLVLKCEGVSDRNQSEALLGKVVQVRSDFFVSDPGEPLFLREVLGFQVFDKSNEIGVVSGITSNGPQDLLVVTHVVSPDSQVKKEYLIPFVEAFLVQVDFDKKKIEMNLPEGLLEL